MVEPLGAQPNSPVLSRTQRIEGLTALVGRDRELGLLSAALSRVAEGEGRTVFLTGQRGIGKTRLAQEALAMAKEMGYITIEARSYPLGVRIAYAPILDAFGPLLRSLDSARLSDLVKGLPDLGRLFGDLGLPFSDSLRDPALGKTRLFEAVTRLLERLTREAPTVLFIDDLHWTDPASLDLLHYLARGLAGERALLLTTYSAEAMDTSRNLRKMVEWLVQAGMAEEIAVPRLNPEAVGSLVRGILNEPASGQLLGLLEARADGTPLFVEEILRAFIDSGALVRTDQGWILDAKSTGIIPATVRRLVFERLDRLVPTERDLLNLVAVMGDATPWLILQRSSGLAEEAFVDALARLQAMGLEMQPKTGNMQRPANSVPTRRSELFARPAVAPHIVPKSGCDSPPLFQKGLFGCASSDRRTGRVRPHI
ncbi:MAG: DUF2791 family P-loop domain-containing protein [Chloroflexi bacterium]|nr:DUF2791 family P-loop domain-containing protein [Chloroflexota bacterium]